jgi:two-component system sensor histidine kinase PilS (NtrC family)
MAAMVAHEVRNPLAGMAGALQILRGRMSEGAAEREVAAQVLERIRSLHRLTEELLLFARPRSPRHERVCPARLLQEAAEVLRSDIRFARLEITLDGSEAEIEGDGELLREAFLNVLLNAAQAMGGSGTVQATVEQADGRCDVHVRDQGPGIPEDLRRRIFEPFFTTRHRGTGLGLAIVKRTVEAHGGEVAASSPSGGGAAIKMSLPTPSAATSTAH